MSIKKLRKRSNINNSHSSLWQLWLAFLKLGLTSFGGPVAHLGYFRNEFVVQRRWLSEQHYADVVALCQFLPGPSSSQTGIAVGFIRAGYVGAVVAWLAFTLPSALLMILFAVGVTHYSDILSAAVLSGLKLAAAAVVFQAVWGMAKQFCNSLLKAGIMLIAAVAVLLQSSMGMQLVVLLLAAFAGYLLLKPAATIGTPIALSISKKQGAVFLVILVFMLLSLPVLAAVFPSATLAIFDIFFRAGALIFGGGHVVLPLLQAEMVNTGMISGDLFMAGYGAVQAVPGPLLTFSAYLGTAMPHGGVGLGFLAVTAIFLPSFLLVFGVLPFWNHLQQYQAVKAGMAGVCAAITGILLAALYQPIWSSTVFSVTDAGLVLLAFLALQYGRIPAWLLVLGYGVAGGMLTILV